MIDKRPFFSIITATYNSEKTLRECIESVLKQDFRDFEFILIDGLSSDGTVAILKAYEEIFESQAIPFKWISERDNGIYDAWNKGVKLAQGEWISFLGSDDEYKDGALKLYFDAIENDNRFNYISSKIDLIDKNDKKIRTVGVAFDPISITKKMSIAQVGSFHHKSLFEKIGLFNTKYRIAGDYDFYLRGRNTLNAGFIDSITVKMRDGGASYQVYKALKEGADIKINLNAASRPAAFYELYLSYVKCYIKKIFRI